MDHWLLPPKLASAAFLAGLLACCSGDADVAHQGEPGAANEVSDSTGTVVLGTDTLDFQVDACDVTSDAPAGRVTLAGHGRLPDDRILRVTVLRTQVDSTTWHSVGLDFGADFWEARRGSSGDGAGWWRLSAEVGEPDLGPLIEIDKHVIRAEGRFVSSAQGNVAPTHGSVSARCPAG